MIKYYLKEGNRKIMKVEEGAVYYCWISHIPEYDSDLVYSDNLVRWTVREIPEDSCTDSDIPWSRSAYTVKSMNSLPHFTSVEDVWKYMRLDKMMKELEK